MSKKSEQKIKSKSDLARKVADHMHDTRKKLGSIDHYLDQIKKPLKTEEKAMHEEVHRVHVDASQKVFKHHRGFNTDGGIIDHRIDSKPKKFQVDVRANSKREALNKAGRIVTNRGYDVHSTKHGGTVSEEAISENREVKVGSKIRYGVETSRRLKGRNVIISRNATVKHMDDDKIVTHNGIELKHDKKVASRSNIEKHLDWHVLKEISNARLRDYVSKAKGDETKSDRIRTALKKLAKSDDIKVPGTKAKWTYKEEVEPLDEASFGSAFAKARKSGVETFDFNGKKFTTRKAGESETQWKSSLKPVSQKAPTPAPRINRDPVQRATGPTGRGRPPAAKKPEVGIQRATGPTGRGRPNVSKPTKPPAVQAKFSIQRANGPTGRGRPLAAKKPEVGIQQPSGPSNRGRPVKSKSLVARSGDALGKAAKSRTMGPNSSSHDALAGALQKKASSLRAPTLNKNKSAASPSKNVVRSSGEALGKAAKSRAMGSNSSSHNALATALSKKATTMATAAREGR